MSQPVHGNLSNQSPLTTFCSDWTHPLINSAPPLMAVASAFPFARALLRRLLPRPQHTPPPSPDGPGPVGSSVILRHSFDSSALRRLQCNRVFIFFVFICSPRKTYYVCTLRFSRKGKACPRLAGRVTEAWRATESPWMSPSGDVILGGYDVAVAVGLAAAPSLAAFASR